MSLTYQHARGWHENVEFLIAIDRDIDFLFSNPAGMF